MRTLCITAIVVVGTCCGLHAQSLRFSWPVEGEPGKDVILVNHVDHDTTFNAIRNYNCTVYTYDGHDGTDFVLRSFRQMDSGVAVLAAADGHVIAVVDTLYDRNKVSIIERGFGNYIAIKHAEGYFTYYAHIRNGSAKVRVGQRVERGDPIALVGSSGNSTDPHLHFEVWRRVDPFAGNCADRTSLWIEQHNISGEHTIVDHGITTWPPLLDTIRERPPNTRLIDTSATTITAWSLHTGVTLGDVFSISWFTPQGARWFEFSSASPTTTNYFYWWSFIDHSPSEMPAGDWTAVVSRNGVEVYRDTFSLSPVVSVELNNNVPNAVALEGPDIEIFDSTGGRVHAALRSLANGAYLVRNAKHNTVVHVLVRDGVLCGVAGAALAHDTIPPLMRR